MHITPAPIFNLCASDGATATVHAHGAHVTAWVPAGETESRLFLSERAVFADGVPIRGGVPVIFPQFAGEGPLPKHGFARAAQWSLQRAAPLADGSAQVVFALTDSTSTRAIWPHAFAATLTVTIGGTALDVRLHVHNTGNSAFRFTAALHTYLSVGDIGQVRVLGLDTLRYRDTADGGAQRQQPAGPLQIAGEVDRNYFETPRLLTLHDGLRQLRIEQDGFDDTVVWNPGAEASKTFKDLAPDDYRRFLCIEAAAIQHPICLEPATEWQGHQRLSI